MISGLSSRSGLAMTTPLHDFLKYQAQFLLSCTSAVQLKLNCKAQPGQVFSATEFCHPKGKRLHDLLIVPQENDREK